jgi:putative flippase GtrA
VKRLLSSLIDVVVCVLATRLLVVAIAAAAVVGFGLGLAGNAVLVAEYSTDRDAVRSERLIASLIVAGNLAFLLSAGVLWRKTSGMKRLYFDIPPRAWIALAVAAQVGGFIAGRWVFNP